MADPGFQRRRGANPRDCGTNLLYWQKTGRKLNKLNSEGVLSAPPPWIRQWLNLGNFKYLILEVSWKSFLYQVESNIFMSQIYRQYHWIPFTKLQWDFQVLWLCYSFFGIIGVRKQMNCNVKCFTNKALIVQIQIIKISPLLLSGR